MSALDRFRIKTEGGEDQSRVFGPCGNHFQLDDTFPVWMHAILAACERLSERVAKLEERALKRKAK